MDNYTDEKVHPSTTLLDLRSDITDQLGTENVPETFVFLRSVGRNFTQVKSKQELDLKVKSFIPPYAEEPELYVKEGSYTVLRSESFGPESRQTSSRIQDSRVSIESSVDFSTSALTKQSLSESNLTSTPIEQITKIKSQNLNGLQSKTSMASRRTAPTIQQRQQYTTQRRYSMARNVRPPTPRVKETPLSDLPLSRSKSKASIKPEEIIPESPTELLDERELPSRSLAVDEESRAAINSPPPRPSSGPNQKNDIQIPVPTPSPTQLNKGKEEHESSKFSIENENSSTERQEFEISKSSVENESDVQLKKSVEFGNLKSSVENKFFSEENQDGSYFVEHLTDTSHYFNYQSGKKHDNSVEDNADERDTDYKVNNINEDDEKYSESSEILPQKDNFESLQLSFENIHSKIGREDVIVDPIKLLEGEGESLKNAEENGRDHYDEGFHSGELVNSEEDSNSIETVGSSETKDEDALKPARAATPMPRSNSFYKPAKGDSETENLLTLYEDTKAERRLKELKREALLQKVKDLQRRKASNKDQAREEWRKRYLDVKRSTPRLEDHCSKLRQELEKLVRDMLVSIKTDPESKPHKPSKKTSYKIMIMRLLQEVEDLRRRLQSVTVKLNAESKLRSQAEFEVKKLRQDLLHKKTQVTLTRKQASFPQTTEQFFISAV